MANYSLVSNAKFRPFSYQEMLAPVLMATQAHQAVEDAYSTLGMSAEEWGSKLNAQRDRESYEKYQAYSNALEKEAEELAKNGLNPSSRQSMLNMRTRYARDINPIAEAWNRRNEQIKAEADLLAKDPTHLFARRASLTSVDDYVRDSAFNTLNESYSGALLQQQVHQAAVALSKNAREDRGIQDKLRHVIGFNYEQLRRNGFKPEEVYAAIMNEPGASKELLNIVDTVLDNSGIGNWKYASEEDKERMLKQARALAAPGLWGSVGQTTYNIVSDDRAKASYESQLAEQRAIAAEERAAARARASSRAAINPSNIYSQEQAAQQIGNINKFKKYFDKNGNMTIEGWKEYNRKVADEKKRKAVAAYARDPEAQKRIINEMPDIDPSEFKVFMDNLNGGRAVTPQKAFGEWASKRFGKLFNDYKNTDFLKYDATKLTEYGYNIDNSEVANYSRLIQEASGGQMEEVEWDNTEKKWKTVKTVSTTDAFGNDAKPVKFYDSYHGNTVTLVDKEGNTKRYRAVRGINSVAEANINRHTAALYTVQNLYTKLGADGRKTLTFEEADNLNRVTRTNVFKVGTTINAATLQKVNADLEDGLITFQSQRGVTNTNKPQEWGALPY